MNRLLLGLMLLLTATTVMAEWTLVGSTHNYIQYVDRTTIRRNGNLVKMWDLRDYTKVKTVSGVSFLSSKTQSEYDCKEEMRRDLAFTWFSGQMGNGNVIYSNGNSSDEWAPIGPGSIAEVLWEIACGKK